MNIYLENIEVKIKGEVVLTNLKWFRGASRYNNGATLYGRKYLIRLVMSWAQAEKIKIV